jgi:pimeloyl-ACP methyl ester carboxylesterase
MNKIPGLVVLVTLLLMSVIPAQADAPPEPREVQIEAADGLMLAGTFYAPSTDVIPGEGWPTVLLLHAYSGTRSVWQPLIDPLTQAGYNALAVDLRGHGDTGGEFVWEEAVGDIQVLLDWLQAESGVRADAVSVIGSNAGGNLALIGCANDEECLTAAALSPGTTGCADCGFAASLFGESFTSMTTSAITEGMRRRATLLVASHFDGESRESITQLLSLARGEINVRFYPGTYSGAEFIGDQATTQDAVIRLLIDWLDVTVR